MATPIDIDTDAETKTEPGEEAGFLGPLTLASGSPRRRQLLASLGFALHVMPSHADETWPAGADCDEGVVALAVRKLEAVRGQWQPSMGPLLAADTVVVHQGEVLGKPADAEEAKRTLQRLSGASHQVITGVAIQTELLGKVHTCAVQTSVQFRTLCLAEIEAYIRSKEPFDKAGAYGIQGLGGALVDRVSGSYPNVVGLPLAEVQALLRQAGVACAQPQAAPKVKVRMKVKADKPSPPIDIEEDSAKVVHRLAAIRAQVAAACKAAGRAPEEVQLVGVCKRQPMHRILAACRAGLEDLGENTVQGMQATAKALDAAQIPVRWHMLGAVQRNKVHPLLAILQAPQAMGRQMLHSLDRPSLLRALAQRCGDAGLDVTVQINLGCEAQKSGILPEDAGEFLALVATFPNIRVRGLMAIPPQSMDGQGHAPGYWFDALAQLRTRLQGDFPQIELHALSMGMSADFETAIAHGATMVRVGAALFGARPG